MPGESSRHSYNIGGKIKDRESNNRNMVLLLPVDENGDEREFYCAFLSTKNKASAHDVGQQTRKESMNSLTSQNQGKHEFFMRVFLQTFH